MLATFVPQQTGQSESAAVSSGARALAHSLPGPTESCDDGCLAGAGETFSATRRRAGRPSGSDGLLDRSDLVRFANWSSYGRSSTVPSIGSSAPSPIVVANGSSMIPSRNVMQLAAEGASSSNPKAACTAEPGLRTIAV